jgi:hypothetical protein
MERTLMRTRRQQALTLVEILVTMIVSSVVLLSAVTMYSNAAGDFVLWSRLRERRFSQAQLDSDIGWLVWQVPPEGLRQNAASWAQATVISKDADGNNITRTVLTYEFSKTEGDFNPGLREEWTGIVFQHGSLVYKFETLRSGISPDSFNAFGTGQLQGFVDTRRADCEILAIGVSELNFAPDTTGPNGIRATWTSKMH